MSQPGTGPIETIFCATDFSQTSDVAVAHAVALARRHGARLLLGHAVEPIPIGPYPMPLSVPDSELVVRDLALERLEAVADPIRDTGLPVDTHLDVGAPGAVLLEMADKAGADVTVIGTRGMTGFQHLVFGSTAEHIVRRSKHPVLTTHPDDGEPRAEAELVIVPTDLSPDAEAAVEAFVRLFDTPSRPRVLLVFADPTPPYLEAFQHERIADWGETDVRMADIRSRMQPTEERLTGLGFEVESQVLDGGPVETITALARDRGADMIVMSTHGRSALVNVLLGRTAQRIVQHAPCPVLTVRPAGRASASATD